MQFVLAFGPLFIAYLAFEPVKQFFDSWMSKVASYVILTALLAAVSTLIVAIATAYVVAIAAGTQTTSNAISDVFGFILLVGVALMLAWQVPNLAASLTGGTPLSSSFMGAVAGAMLRDRSTDRSRGAEGAGGGTNTGSNNNGGGSNGEDRGGSPNFKSSGGTPAYRRAVLNRMDATNVKFSEKKEKS